MNPWLSIPLAAYEAHMSLPEVAQAAVLSDIFRETLKLERPRSVALIGCAGGNGLEHLDPAVTNRAVAVDINPDYLEVCRRRFPRVETVCADITEPLPCAPVDLAHVALVLEYVDPQADLANLRGVASTLSLVLQLPSETTTSITPSPYGSLGQLAPIHRLIDPDSLGLAPFRTRIHTLPGGKRFWHALIR